MEQQGCVLRLAESFSLQDEGKVYPQQCWETLKSALHSIVEQPDPEIWASFVNLIVDFPGRVASIYQEEYPVGYFPQLCALLLTPAWLQSLSVDSHNRMKGILSRLLLLSKETAIAAALLLHPSEPCFRVLLAGLSPVEKLLLALIKSSPSSVPLLVPTESPELSRKLLTFVPIRIRIGSQAHAEELRGIFTHYGSPVEYVAREWSHVHFVKRLDEVQNRSLTLLLHAYKDTLTAQLLPILAEGVQLRLACSNPEFHRSGLLLAAILAPSLAPSLPASDHIQCSIEDYCSPGPQSDSDDEENDTEQPVAVTPYLSDLIESLDCDSKERVERAICSAASLVAENLDELDVEGARLAETLLKTGNRFALEAYEEKKEAALVALATVRPEMMLESLGKRLLEDGDSSRFLALSVLLKAAEVLSKPETSAPVARLKPANTSKTRYFHLPKPEFTFTTPFVRLYPQFFEKVLKLLERKVSNEVGARSLRVLARLFELAAHIRSPDVTRAAVYSLRNCVLSLNREWEEAAAALVLVDRVLVCLVAPEAWEEHFTQTLADYPSLSSDLAALLRSLEALRQPGLQPAAEALAGKLRVLQLI